MNIDRILQVANRLREMQNFDTEMVDRLASKLESEWNKLYTAVERRSTMLQASVSFHKSSEQYVAQCKIWMDELNAVELKDINSQAVYEVSSKLLFDDFSIIHCGPFSPNKFPSTTGLIFEP